MAYTVGACVPQFVFQGTLTFASVPSSATAWQTQTITLAAGQGQFPNLNGMLLLQLPNLQASLMVGNLVPLTSTTFQVSVWNSTGGALTPTGTSATLVMI